MARHQNGLSLCNLLLIIQMFVFKLIVLPLSSTFFEDSFLLSITLIGFKQLACITHSIEGPMNKLVDTDDELFQHIIVGLSGAEMCTVYICFQRLFLSNILGSNMQ